MRLFGYLRNFLIFFELQGIHSFDGMISFGSRMAFDKEDIYLAEVLLNDEYMLFETKYINPHCNDNEYLICIIFRITATINPKFYNCAFFGKHKITSTNDNDIKNSNNDNMTAIPNDDSNPNTTLDNYNNNTNITTSQNVNITSGTVITDEKDEKDEKTVDNDNVDTLELKRTFQFACEIVLLSTVAGGFVRGVEGSTEIVLFRLDKGYEIDDNGNPIQRWSQPCAIAGGGVSAGFQMGISNIDQFIILTHPRHVKTFMGHGQFQVGAKAEAAIGDQGASAGGSVNVSDKFVSEMLCYTLKQKDY